MVNVCGKQSKECIPSLSSHISTGAFPPGILATWLLQSSTGVLGVVLACALVAPRIVGQSTSIESPPPLSRPNVLFLAIDDLRQDLEVLGVPRSATPRLDTLAAQGRAFTQHYVQVPTCGASRCALLRGRYPDRNAHLANSAIFSTQTEWRDQSLPATLKRAGYQTLALGKVTHHPGGRTGTDWLRGPAELEGVWHRSWIPESPWITPAAMMHAFAHGKRREPGVSPALEPVEGSDHTYPDAWIADEAIRTLQTLAHARDPWFFAVGLLKPHLPFAAPKRWFDEHQPETWVSRVNEERPIEPGAWHGSGEFRGNYGHGGRDPENDTDYARELRHAYVASMSYMDAQVGRILHALKSLGLDHNTVVIAWSDHGFLLGEHGIWGKHCLYSEALRAPLIIRTPELAQPGTPSEAIVETVDIFPTLLDICRVPAPADLDGLSLRPYLLDPQRPSAKPARGFWTGNQRSLRTEQWHYIRYGNGTEQLFDLVNDPGERTNLARLESSADILSRLRSQLPD